jgi:probable HAF family extracellular repeat protein
MRAITSLVISLSWTFSGTAWAAPPFPEYVLTEIPSIGAGFGMSATAINDRGEVVGIASTLPNLPYQGGPFAFFYQHSSGAVNKLTFGSEQGSYAFGINDKGIIAGYAETPDLPQAVLWSSTGGAEGLGPATIAMAVNNNGTVVGNFDCEVADCAAVWSGPNHVFASLPDLPFPPPPPYCFAPPPHSNALAINNKGHIVGWAETAGDCGGGAVEWRDGRITLLAPDVAGAYESSVANGLNDRDDVVGVSGDHAFLYHRGTLSDLGTLPGDASSSANAINNDGEIVGGSVATDGVTSRAFIYVDGRMCDLNSLLDASSSITGSVKLEEAVGINSHGSIAANGTRDGRQYAYLLKRVRAYGPLEPMSSTRAPGGSSAATHRCECRPRCQTTR